MDLPLIRRYLEWRFGLPARIVEPVGGDAGRRQTARPLRRRASQRGPRVVGRRAAARGWLRRIACFVATLAVFSGCSDDEPPVAAPTSTSTTSAPSTSITESTSRTVPPAEAEVRAAYEAASRAFIEAAALPDPEYPALLSTHTDPMLEQRRNVLLALKADGRVIRYPQPTQYSIEIETVEVDQDVARLVACVVDDGERVEAASGRVVAGGTGTVQWRAAMRRIDGTWKLAERVEAQRWDGVAGCAAP